MRKTVLSVGKNYGSVESSFFFFFFSFRMWDIHVVNMWHVRMIIHLGYRLPETRRASGKNRRHCTNRLVSLRSAAVLSSSSSIIAFLREPWDSSRAVYKHLDVKQRMGMFVLWDTRLEKTRVSRRTFEDFEISQTLAHSDFYRLETFGRMFGTIRRAWKLGIFILH